MRTVTLFGRWLVSKDLGLSFETETYGVQRSISFGGEFGIGPKNSVSVSLKDREGERLGIELVLTRDFFPSDGTAFLRLKKSLEGSRLEAGTSFRF